MRLLKVPHRCPDTPKAQETRVLVLDLQVRPGRQQAHVQEAPPQGLVCPCATLRGAPESTLLQVGSRGLACLT